MTDVVIAGIGQTPVGEHWELSLRNLTAQAILAGYLPNPERYLEVDGYGK